MTKNSATSCHEACTALHTYSDALALARELGLEIGDAAALICGLLNISRAALYAFGERSISHHDMQQIVLALQQRQLGMPVAYLLGRQEFYGLSLRVDANVLIPRSDTETLVNAALAAFPAIRVIRALDLGTGSGAIALAIKSARPHWHVHASDVCARALQVARENAVALGLEVHFALGDWLAPHHSRFDVIVANPPYIAPMDAHLALGDLRFEPIAALVAPEQGLRDLRSISQAARNFLQAGGWLMLEHGYDQARQVQAMLSDFEYANINTINDLGDNPRVTMGQAP